MSGSWLVAFGVEGGSEGWDSVKTLACSTGFDSAWCCGRCG